eukprot:6373825-Karenia_brevis.AAC.1
MLTVQKREILTTWTNGKSTVRSKIMTLFDATAGEKNVDAKEEKVDTKTAKSAEQDAEEVSTRKGEQSMTARTKSATKFHRISRIQKKTNLWIKFAI